ncbi:MAG TPA: ABC transporter [Firmicutes bacterium]|nr:ABC transporter [Bacillota bacterium]
MLDSSIPILSVERLSFCYGEQPILADLNFQVPTGSFTGIIGPNGSGKTTLLKCLNKTLTPTDGQVVFCDQDLRGIRVKTLARMMGVVPQQWAADFAFTVREVVMMGRFPYLHALSGEQAADWEIGRRAMEMTKTWELADRPITQLSGGERQRVLIAQALAQTPRLLLLDEPTSHLDVSQTLEICALIAELIRKQGLTIIAVFHDLNLAGRYCDNLLLLKAGRIYAQGSPEKVLTVENVEAVFGMRAVVGTEPFTGRPYLFYAAEKDFLARKQTP